MSGAAARAARVVLAGCLAVAAGCSGRPAPEAVTTASPRAPATPSYSHDSATLFVTMAPAPGAGPVTTIRTPFRYVFAAPERYGWRDDEPATIENGVAFVGRDGALVAFDLATRREVRLANVFPNRGAFVSGTTVVYGFGEPGTPGIVAAIERATGAPRWRRRGYLIGAGSGYVLLRAPPTDPASAGDPSAGELTAVDVATGARSWVIPWAGCAPQRPIRFFARWVVLDWAGSCGASANEPFLMFLRLRDGAMRNTRDATAILAVRGNELYLTGDDSHFGNYGPGNLSVYDTRSATLVRKRRIAPDAPASADVAFNLEAGGYALGDALWVELNDPEHPYAAAVYRYDRSDMRARPGRLDPHFGTWLGAAFGDEAYVARGNALVALVANSSHAARAEPFAGGLAHAAEAIADERFVYVREAGGRIAVFARAARRQVRVVDASCARLLAIKRVGALRYALCVEPGDTVPAREALVSL